MGYVFLVSPYSDPDPVIMEERYCKTLAAAACLHSQHSVPVYSPIIHWHPVAVKYGLSRVAANWQQASAPLIRAAEEVMVFELPGWLTSEGVKTELSAARVFGTPINHLTVQHVNNWLESQGYTPV